MIKFAEPCGFINQSILFNFNFLEVFFIPKLQNKIAEFLKVYLLEVKQLTCVGLSTVNKMYYIFPDLYTLCLPIVFFKIKVYTMLNKIPIINFSMLCAYSFRDRLTCYCIPV